MKPFNQEWCIYKIRKLSCVGLSRLIDYVNHLFSFNKSVTIHIPSPNVLEQDVIIGKQGIEQKLVVWFAVLLVRILKLRNWSLVPETRCSRRSFCLFCPQSRRCKCCYQSLNYPSTKSLFHCSTSFKLSSRKPIIKQRKNYQQGKLRGSVRRNFTYPPLHIPLSLRRLNM